MLVNENAFEKMTQRKETEENKKIRKKSEKDDKNKNWWDKLLSWLLYDEIFVKGNFNRF